MSDKSNTKEKQEFTRKRSRMMFLISQMPPKTHWDKQEPYDVNRSEVCRWLSQQPDFMEWCIQKAKDMGAIEFKDGKWVGVNYGVVQSSE